MNSSAPSFVGGWARGLHPRLAGVLKRQVAALSGVIGDELVAITLHGSVAMGCFNPEASDLDFLVVVRAALPKPLRRKVARFFLHRGHDWPPKGIEMSVVRRSVASRPSTAPPPYEFHAGTAAQTRFHAAARPGGFHDSDLPLHFAMARARGRAIIGPPPARVFGRVPPVLIGRALRHDFDWSAKNVEARTPDHPCRVPTYAVLNACRMVAWLGSNRFLSKREGGLWALDHFPQESCPVIVAALLEYRRAKSAPLVEGRELRRLMDHAAARLAEAGY